MSKPGGWAEKRDAGFMNTIEGKNLSHPHETMAQPLFYGVDPDRLVPPDCDRFFWLDT